MYIYIRAPKPATFKYFYFSFQLILKVCFPKVDHPKRILSGHPNPSTLFSLDFSYWVRGNLRYFWKIKLSSHINMKSTRMGLIWCLRNLVFQEHWICFLDWCLICTPTLLILDLYLATDFPPTFSINFFFVWAPIHDWRD